MNIKFTRYDNEGKGFKQVYSEFLSEEESKVIVSDIKNYGFLRVIGSGMIGMTFENNDLEKNTQVTFERVVD